MFTPESVDRTRTPCEVRNVSEPVVLHMIEETAMHSGHLEIARELLDGEIGRGQR